MFPSFPFTIVRRPLIILAACVLALFIWHPFDLRTTGAASPAIMQLTSNTAINVRPAWSPDNKTIAFQSNRDGDGKAYHIYVMNADGSNQRALTKGTNDDRHPVFMPDGKSILFDSDDGAHEEIWMVNVADGSLKQITHSGATANFPSPSPDGQHLAYYVYSNETLDLWTARMDGSEAKPVTQGLANAASNQCTFACHYAAWNSDNKTLAYSSGDHGSVFTVQADGTGSQQVIANDERNHFPWYMPDGRMGYITEHVTPNQSFTDAWAYDPQSGKTTLLHDQMSPQGPFEWSNDGTKVLFHSPRAGNFDIYLIDLAAPGGVAALQGKQLPPDQVGVPAAPAATAVPLPNQQAPDQAAPNQPVVSQPAVSQPAGEDNTLPLLAGAAIVLLGIVGFAVFAVFRNRDGDI